MVGALALCPTGNAQGGFYFLSLSTGRVLNRLRATAFPMPDHVVDQVHRMARQQKANPGLLFGNRSMSSVNDGDMEESSDDDDDDKYVPEDEDADEMEIAGDEDPSHDYKYDDTGSIESEYNDPTDDHTIDTGDVGMGTDTDVNSVRSDDGAEAEVPENLGVDDAGSDENTVLNRVESQGVDELNNDIAKEEVDDVERPEEKEDNESTEDGNASIAEAHDEIENETGYNLWGNWGRSYKHLYDPEVFDTGKGNDNKQTKVMMTTTDDAPEETAQMPMKKGLKVFGEQGYATVRKEMQQLYDRKVMQGGQTPNVY